MEKPTHVDEAALLWDYGTTSRLIDIPVRTLRRHVAERTGPRVVRIGRHVRFRPQDVRDWIERLGQRETEDVA